MKKILNKHRGLLYTLALVCVIIASVIVVTIFGIRKQGYHTDEIYSFGLANSNYKPFLDSHDKRNESPQKLSPEYYDNYVTVDSSTKFNYGSVIYNQEHDVHPPLFYIILHTICSFFPGQFNKWFGIAPNIIFFIVTLVTIFLTAKRLTKNRLLPILCVALYGFSSGAICSVIYIRMYMLLTMFASLYTYVHVQMITQKRQSFANLLALIVITFLGFYTQYYFLIYAFFISLGYFIFLCISKQWHYVRNYILTMLVPFIAMFIIYPYGYKTILGINSDIDGFDHAKYAASSQNQFLSSFIEFFSFLNQQLFSNLLLPIMLILSILLLYALFRKIYNIEVTRDGILLTRSNRNPFNKIILNTQVVSILICLFASIGYLIVVAKITYFKVDRYIFPIYPIVAMVYTIVSYGIFALCIKYRRYLATILIVATSIVILAMQYSRYLPSGNFPDTLYPSDQAINDYMDKHTGDTCIYVYDEGDEWADMLYIPWLRKCGSIYKTSFSDADQYLLHDIDYSKTNKSYTLFVEDSNNADISDGVKKFVSKLSKKLDKSSPKHIGDINAWNHWSVPATTRVFSVQP